MSIEKLRIYILAVIAGNKLMLLMRFNSLLPFLLALPLLLIKDKTIQEKTVTIEFGCILALYIAEMVMLGVNIMNLLIVGICILYLVSIPLNLLGGRK